MSDDRQQTEGFADPWESAPNHLAYRVCRENVTGLLEARPDAAGLTVPACPDWTVRDLVAHLVGNCRATHGSLTRVRAQPLPAAEPGLGELLEEWSRTGSALETLMAKDDDAFGILVMDTFTHELDIRRALDVPPPADHPAYPGALRLVVGGFSGTARAYGLPTLRIETQGAHWVTGSGEAAATVRAHRHDLYRSLAGRRTPDQIAELSWSGPCEKWLPAFTWGPFHPPAQATEDLIGLPAAH